MSDWSPWFRLVIAILATWRVAHLIAREDGPFDLVVKLRILAGEGFAGRLMDCPLCLSLWVAAPFALTLTDAGTFRVEVWLAISGGASLLENAFERLSRTANTVEGNSGE